MTSKVLALAAAETKLVLRNRTVAVSSVLLPVALGAFWAWSFNDGNDNLQITAMVVALQIAVVLGMGIYVTATQTVVARRHSRVLKRMRTSGLSDTGLLAAIIVPSVVIGIVQLAVFAVINAVTGTPLPVEPLPLVIAVLGGLALVVTAALATAVVTPSPERAQITTLPLVFVMLGAAIALVFLPTDGWWQALVAVPGAAIGELTRLAFGGSGGADTVLPPVLAATVALLAWAAVFGYLALRRFRWDPRT